MKYLSVGILLFFLSACGGGKQTPEPPAPCAVIFGYVQYGELPEYRIPWEKLTHLSIAFGRVSPEGHLLAPGLDSLMPLFREGRAKGVKVLLSVGGGASETMTGVLQNDTLRKRIKNELVGAVGRWQLDGLDIDYEEWTGGPGGSAGEEDARKAENLELFCKELREALPQDALLTAAVSADYPDWNGGWGNYAVFRNSMFRYLDLVHVMVYDFTGKWKTSKVAQHASMEHFRAAAAHWAQVRQVPKGKIILGVPFYGVRFVSGTSPEGAVHIPYKDILARYRTRQPAACDRLDWLFYNGRPTVREKAEFVKAGGYGGIMIWALSHDASSPDESLLQVIYDVFTE